MLIFKLKRAANFISRSNFDGLVNSLILDGAVNSSKSRLAQFRRMQRSYLYVKFLKIARNADIGLFTLPSFLTLKVKLYVYQPAY